MQTYPTAQAQVLGCIYCGAPDLRQIKKKSGAGRALFWIGVVTGLFTLIGFVLCPISRVLTEPWTRCRACRKEWPGVTGIPTQAQPRAPSMLHRDIPFFPVVLGLVGLALLATVIGDCAR